MNELRLLFMAALINKKNEGKIKRNSFNKVILIEKRGYSHVDSEIRLLESANKILSNLGKR